MPTIVDFTSGTSAASTSHAITLPATYAVGDFLVVVAGVDGAATISATTAGWVNNNLGGGTNVLTKVAAGSDTLTITIGNAEEVTYASYAINGANAIDFSAGVDQFVTTNINPPSLTLSQERDALWFATFDVSGAATLVSYPPNYTDGQVFISFADAFGVAARSLTATTEDPDPWTTSGSESGRGHTFAVYNGNPVADVDGIVALTDNSTSTFIVPEGVTNLEEVLIVAGGGSGGSGRTGGGGGAGEVVRLTNVAVTPGQVIPYTVGAGGAGYNTIAVTLTTAGLRGNSGQNSVFGATTAIGGGGGGGWNSTAIGLSGGSGGGGGSDLNGAERAGGASTASAGFGNAGGAGGAATSRPSGGGGGGAGAVGVPGGEGVTWDGGAGGDGLFFEAFAAYGDSGYFGGGGGGGAYTVVDDSVGGSGGLGGGSASPAENTASTAGLPNTGGGSGAVWAEGAGVSVGAGGSGVVLIKLGSPTPPFPVVTDSTSGVISRTRNQVSVPLPTFVTGQQLLVFYRPASGTATAVGWNTDFLSNSGVYVFSRVATSGSDSLIVTHSSNVIGTYIAYAISDGNVVEVQDGSTPTTTTAINPPSLTLDAERDALWFAGATWSTTSATLTSYPTNYDTDQLSEVSTSNSQRSLATASYGLTSNTENPGAFTTSSVSGSGFTAAVYFQTPWLLLTGLWNDDGEWDDTALWDEDVPVEFALGTTGIVSSSSLGLPEVGDNYVFSAVGLEITSSLGLPAAGELASFEVESLVSRVTIGRPRLQIEYPFTAIGLNISSSVGVPRSGRNYVLGTTSIQSLAEIQVPNAFIITDLIQVYPRTVRVPAENRTLRIRNITR